MAKSNRTRTANTPEQNVAEELSNQEVVETTTNAPVVEEKAETASAPIAEKVENVQEGNVEEAPEKLVSCMGLKNHTARIGGKIFEVVKDRTLQFPPNVAVLLQRSGHLIVK